MENTKVNFDILARGCGSSEAQILSFTNRINEISVHVKSNKADHSAQRGLNILLGKRKRLLNYLKAKDSNMHSKMLEIISSK